MTQLDQPRTTSRSPATWTGDRVRQRLVEAFATERKLPGQHFVKVASSWPMAVQHEFTDILHWDDARERIWQSWEHAKGAFPYEVTQMEEAQGWLRWLPDDERHYLDAWAKCEAFGIAVSKLLRKRGWAKTSFYRKINDASARIADRLNRQGVMVR